jgi:hypothetical protein
MIKSRGSQVHHAPIGEKMQLTPDWRAFWRAEQFNRELHGLEFRGPGFYLDEGNTVLVIPQPPQNAATPSTVWNAEQPEGTLYEVNVYNCNFRETIFAATATAPIRYDTR